MSSTTDNGSPWNERLALEELEHLRQQIGEWRKRRIDVQAEFDRFVGGFRTPTREPDAVEKTSTSAAPPPIPGAKSQISRSAAPPTASEIEREPLPVPPEPAGAQLPDPPTTAPAEVRQPLVAQRRTRVAAIVGTVTILGAAGLLLSRSLRDTPVQPTTTHAGGVSQPALSSGSRTPGPAPVDAPRSEITALRRVWVRIVADGVREVERELRPGERVPLRAGRTFVIRTGDAGAIGVTIDGQDRGTLGAEGEVVTRTLKTPPAANR
jgi:hypothetical protein